MNASGMLLALACLSLPAAFDSDDVPSFKKRGDDEKAFVSRVGEAVVRAARLGPLKIKLEKYEFTDPRKNRKELKIVMNWQGGITRKKIVSTIVVKIDTPDKDRWEVVKIDYSDNSVSLIKHNKARVEELIKKLNR